MSFLKIFVKQAIQDLVQVWRQSNSILIKEITHLKQKLIEYKKASPAK